MQRFERAFHEMAELEAGAIANKDEHRMVGHYWLRAPELAPTKSIAENITRTQAQVIEFAAKVHRGEIRGTNGRFDHVILIGIGGSALGPQFVSDALCEPASSPMGISFLDNTDPDGLQRVFSTIRDFGTTLCLVVSKSGATKETRNGMIETMARYRSKGLRFSPHAVAITGAGSELDKFAEGEGWLARFPMWDWVGGRTSQMSGVGLLPAALQGIDVTGLLAGARDCDQLTRHRDVMRNPAALVAAMWFASGNGQGLRDMVVLPYRDRLVLFSRYLQQLVMESLGKSKTRAGTPVNQGIAVYGNKGSTDQHAYIQQLRDGLDNFFVTFIEVLEPNDSASIEVDPMIRSVDYLSGFMHGTREALTDGGRQSVTITLNRANARTIGSLIALFERAVGLYASIIDVNAYHQPGVEAGKQAASRYLETQVNVIRLLTGCKSKWLTVEDIASKLGTDADVEAVLRICVQLAASGRIVVDRDQGSPIINARFCST